MLSKKEFKMVDEKYKSQFYLDWTNDETGPVARWHSNDKIPFADMLQNFVDAGWMDAQIQSNSLAQRIIEDRAAIEAYRANYRGPSTEEMLEARAEFGPGARVVNVLTGASYTV
jgi:hypothetical protein